jgi:ankyrin repeat protein
MVLTDFENAVIENNLMRVTAMVLTNPEIVNTPNQLHIAPLSLAVARGTPDMVDLLIAGGAQINVRQGKFGSLPLITAVIRHRQDNLIILLKCGADVRMRDGSGRTALDWALHLGYKEIAEVLVRYGASSIRQPSLVILFPFAGQDILIKNTSGKGWCLLDGRSLF